jgi:SAM-dependent methyltransferase
VTSRRPWTLRRISGGIGRRVPLRPFRILFPFRVWRQLFRLWLETIRAQPDRRKALRELLEVYGDAYVVMDRGAVDYGRGEHPKHRLTRYHDFFVERIRPGERVLDVGCGIGSVARDIAERSGATVVGLDVSPWALEVARTRFTHPRVSYVQGDVLGYEPDAPFDVAVLSNVLEHVGPRRELLEALRKRDGATRLLVRVPSLERDWTVPLRDEVGLSYFSDPDHELEYTQELLREELHDAGWEMGEPTLAWGEIWVEATAVAPA